MGNGRNQRCRRMLSYAESQPLSDPERWAGGGTVNTPEHRRGSTVRYRVEGYGCDGGEEADDAECGAEDLDGRARCDG